ncbi:sensor histidine kinase/response regulator hybrid [Planoprotostelium fungivorum]|uniref:Sensor histidine kinase/response regulator hybrid n=1 Tax=Planoprotostelium fungivorum TaxID=1890364 RepID=A0A2P6NGY6_9EUKA|nr:sensor histidine kinase/response regulator hybrid [Planoprotostelium fungivorum]
MSRTDSVEPFPSPAKNTVSLNIPHLYTITRKTLTSKTQWCAHKRMRGRLLEDSFSSHESGGSIMSNRPTSDIGCIYGVHVKEKMAEVETPSVLERIQGVPFQAWQGYEFYRTFYNFSPMPMGVVRAFPDDMFNVDCNVAAATYFGRPVEEVRGRTSSSMGAPLDCIQEWLSVYRESLEHSKPRSFTYISPCATDQNRYLCCTIYPIYGEHFAYIINDVTHIKKAELKAVQLQTKNEMIVNSLDTVVWEVDAQTGRFQFVSDRTEECLNMTRAEWDRYEDFFDRHVSPSDRTHLPKLNDIPEGIHMDFTLRTTHNCPIGTHAKVSLCKSDDAFGGKMIVGTMRGIFSENSEPSTNSEKHKISSEISEEIRGPLNRIMGAIELVSDMHITENVKDILSNVKSCTLSLQTTIDALSEEPTLRGVEMMGGRSAIHMRSIIEDAVDTVSNKAEEKGIDLITCYPTNVPGNFSGNSSIHIRQTILHLLEFSIRFTQRGQISIGMEFESLDPQIIIALPFSQRIYNTIVDAFEGSSEYPLSGDSAMSSLLHIKLSIQAAGARISLSHSDSATFIRCSLPIRPIGEIQEQHKMEDKTVWTTLEEDSLVDAPLFNQLSVWNVKVSHLSPEDLVHRLTSNAQLADYIVVDDEHLANLEGIHVAKPLVVVTRYSRYRSRQLHDLQLVNLFRPVNSTKLHHVLARCRSREEETISIQGSPDSSPAMRPTKRKMEQSLSDRPRVLVLDPSEISQKSLSLLLAQQEFDSSTAQTFSEAHELLRDPTHIYDVILVDVTRDGDGEIGKKLRELCQENGRSCPALFALTNQVNLDGYDRTIKKPVRGSDLRRAYGEYESRRARPRI